MDHLGLDRAFEWNTFSGMTHYKKHKIQYAMESLYWSFSLIRCSGWFIGEKFSGPYFSCPCTKYTNWQLNHSKKEMLADGTNITKLFQLWRVPVLGGPKIVEKGQLVYQSSGFLLEFSRRFQYIFYVLTVEKHVQFCVFVGDERVTTDENPLPPVQRRYSIECTRGIGFSSVVTVSSPIKTQNCTCISTVNT